MWLGNEAKKGSYINLMLCNDDDIVTYQSYPLC